MEQQTHELNGWRSRIGDRINTLTTRERDVLDSMLVPQTTKETARTMGISPRTVETHRGRVLAKLGARNVRELLVLLTRTQQDGAAGTVGGEDGVMDSGTRGGEPMTGEAEPLCGLTYSSRLDPTCITVMLVWGEAEGRFGCVLLPEGLTIDIDAGVAPSHEPIPVEGAIAYGVYLALKTRHRLRLGGDATVWDPEWGPLRQATRSNRLS